MFEAQVTEDYTPKALLSRPLLTAYEGRSLEQFVALSAERAEGFSGPQPLTLSDIERYLTYYPLYDTYYFIDLMRSIDRLWLSNVRKQTDR